MARAWRGGVLGAVFCAACVSPAWATVNVEGVPFDDAARVAGRELLLNGTGLRSVFVIKGYVAGLYLPERAKNAAVILGMKGPKRLQIHPLRDVGADTFIHALNDGIHRNQTEIQVQKLADRLTLLQDAMRQIGSTKRGDTINFDYAPDAGTIISINGVTRTMATVARLVIGLKSLSGSYESFGLHAGLTACVETVAMPIV